MYLVTQVHYQLIKARVITSTYLYIKDSDMNFKFKGTEYFIKPDTEWWTLHWKKVAAGIAVVFLALMLFGCNAGVSSGTPEPTTFACQGSYVGSYSPPEHEERIKLRNESLTRRGIAIVADEAENNKNAGGGAPDGGIWMGGNYSFEADANCNVKGTTNVFYAYPYEIVGTIAQDRTFKLTWQGSGSAGRMDGKVETDGNITGTFHHPEPESYIYGVISGSFTAK